MNTTYEQIWAEFEPIAKFDEYDLPTTVDGRRALIRSAIKIFNKKMFDELQGNDADDTVDRALSDSEMNLLTHCMRLQICRNIHSEFTTTYDMYKNDIGFKNYKAQIDARQNLINMEEQEINEIVFSMQESFEGEGAE